MPIDLTYPGVYLEEIPGGVHPIEGVPTSEAAFVDFFDRGPLHEATRIDSFADLEKLFGGLDKRSEASYGIQQYFLNGGSVAWVVRVAAAHDPSSSEWNNEEGADAILGGSECGRKGIYALKGTGFNILCLPAAANLSATGFKRVYEEAAKFCAVERAFLIVDIPPGADTPKKAIEWLDASQNPDALPRDKNAAVYFPRLTIADPLTANQQRNVGASGTMAGVYARIDDEGGVWKAPAGTKARLKSVNLVTTLTDDESNILNRLAINSLRHFPDIGNVCWGARTLEGSDHQNSDWKYISVRRTALYLERAIHEGTEWVAFEQNDEPLWAKIRLNVGLFLQILFCSGAFQGSTAREAYFVKCDRSFMTEKDIERGLVNITVGFAPLRPAEFVIIQIQRLARYVEA